MGQKHVGAAAKAKVYERPKRGKVAAAPAAAAVSAGRPSALLDTRVIGCGDNSNNSPSCPISV
jgi:hypothetical protein